jgi:hypothetical protein
MSSFAYQWLAKIAQRISNLALLLLAVVVARKKAVVDSNPVLINNVLLLR